ncbi:Gfo/Idh/MocA family oxidoreductase [Microbacterium sp. X-17]|uniref:Gfo/Idh/MocA family protein n=1 Tax=Microbacterium sp. X-17 TaxID=3144404 RepID=UPI0031F5369A
MTLPRTLPDPELFLPNSGEPVLRWGVLAPGGIAAAFAGALRANTAQRLHAVGSRTLARAEAFAARHGAANAYGSYEQLVADPEVDVVYVAAPQSEHLALGLLAIGAGKHVLIEKPMATNARDALRLVAAATEAGVFLMEAMWTRYLPQTSVIRQLLADGVLGAVRAVTADHGQAIPFDPQSRLYRKDLGGGALLDLGIYPIQLDSMVLGAPTAVTAHGRMTETGVDATSTLVLAHGPDAQSTLTTTLEYRTPTVGVISGDEAFIQLDGPFHVPNGFTLSGNGWGGPRVSWSDPTFVGLFNGLSWEANALARFVGEGRRESPIHTLEETVSILETIDEAMRQLA